MKITHALQITALMLASSCGLAQEIPRAEVSFDYSFAHYNPSALYTQGHSLNGGGGTITFNAHPYIGVMADFQGYNSFTTAFTIPKTASFPNGANGTVSGNLFTYMIGPVVKERIYRYHPFVDLLFGAAHSNVYGSAYEAICQHSTGNCAFSGSPSSDAFAMSAGGGIDLPMNDYFDFRVGQIDYLATDFSTQFTHGWQHNFRFVAGVNIKMGTLGSRPQH